MKTAKILYIDDETDLLELASMFFQDEQLPIDVCSNVPEAMELIREKNYDLIISDANMPSGNGHMLFDILRKEGFLGKIILVTGDIQEFKSVSKSNFDIVLYKPIKFQELVAEVKKLLGEEFKNDGAVIRSRNVGEDTGFFNLGK